jgi:histidinol-phosphatase (PHP family)
MNRNLDYCYHTHTTRCGHAYGTDEAYVLAAIEKGMKVLGFSDHIFFPGIYQPGMRGDFSLLKEYIQSIHALQSKYKDKITIYLGFEAEYYPEFESYYQDLFNIYKFDYLILGHHFRFTNGEFPVYYGAIEDLSLLEEYALSVVTAMKSGYFSYLAHPDLFMMGYKPGWDMHTEKISTMIIDASIQYGVPLELNLGGVNGRGMRMIGTEHRYPYPYAKFWELVGKKQASTIIGIDCHDPSQFLKGNEQILFEYIDLYKLKYQDRLKMKTK